ncbi:MAG: hypothetical protein ABIH25_01375 [Candidatus Woesearchaeota archaeon]
MSIFIINFTEEKGELKVLYEEEKKKKRKLTGVTPRFSRTQDFSKQVSQMLGI